MMELREKLNEGIEPLMWRKTVRALVSEDYFVYLV